MVLLLFLFYRIAAGEPLHLVIHATTHSEEHLWSISPTHRPLLPALLFAVVFYILTPSPQIVDPPTQNGLILAIGVTFYLT